MSCNINYFKSIFIAIDQLINAIFRGWPDETLSSRAYRLEKNNITSIPRKIIDILFFFDKNHCEESYISERIDRYLPPELRNGDWMKYGN